MDILTAMDMTVLVSTIFLLFWLKMMVATNTNTYSVLGSSLNTTCTLSHLSLARSQKDKQYYSSLFTARNSHHKYSVVTMGLDPHSVNVVPENKLLSSLPLKQTISEDHMGSGDKGTNLFFQLVTHVQKVKAMKTV